MSVFNLELFVKLLPRAFPAVVAPQIEARLAPYGLLEHDKELFGYLKLRHFAGLVGHELEGVDIFSAFGAFNVDVEHGVVHLAHYALGAREHRCVVVEERQPQVDVAVAGCLVGYVAEEIHEVLAAERHEISQYVLLGDAHSAHALAHVDEQAVEELAAQGWYISPITASGCFFMTRPVAESSSQLP